MFVHALVYLQPMGGRGFDNIILYVFQRVITVGADININSQTLMP